MSFLVNLGSNLLSFAHGLFQPGFCPGDWVWATIAAGALIALLPALGSLLVALARKGTGNTYNPATITFGRASSIRVASSRGAKPPNTTECTAPRRAQASMAITASGIIGM